MSATKRNKNRLEIFRSEEIVISAKGTIPESGPGAKSDGRRSPSSGKAPKSSRRRNATGVP